MDRAPRLGQWEPLEGMDLAGKRLGVVGTGGIGATFMRLADAFGIEVVAWNRSPPVQALPGRMVPLAELLETSDVVSLHLALIDKPALIAALEVGRLGHAALEVLTEEPLPAGHALTRLTNVTLTAHAGYKTPEASLRLLTMSLDLAARDLAVFRGGGDGRR